MTLISLAVIVMAIAFVAIAIALVPALIEIRKTAVCTREFLARTEADLKPVITELHDTLADVRALTATFNAGSTNLNTLFAAAGETGRGLRTISSAISGVSGVVSSSSLWLTGVKVASKFIMERINKRNAQRTGGDNHGE